jgi:hypothetical protein
MQDGSRASVHGEAARPQARAVQSRESERSAGGLGNMSVARHFQQGAAGAAFGGTPLGNQQELGRARVQAKCAECENQSRRMNVQAKCTTCASGERAGRDPAVVPTAVAGVSSASSPLPHRERIQSAFGQHDISHVRAAVGGDAGQAADQLGAAAYTVGDRIAFRADPDVRLAAHEAAHVVQQRSGLKLAGNVGTPGDRYERAADAVADAVVDGRPADHLLDDAAAEAPASPKVQMQWAHTQHPGMPQYPTQPQPPGNNCDQRGISALMTEAFESKADLDAVRAIAPDVAWPPENAEVAQWNAYAGKYFPRRLAELESDFAKGKDPAHKGPLTWEGYLESEAKLGPVRGQKKFQPELRNQILAENPQLDPKNVEIDVGLSPTRKGVAKGPFYADVVVEDVSDPKSPQLEVYSSKVHNVAAARVSRKTDLQIQKWIEARMAEDVAEAADKYGHEVEFRRPRQSRAGDGRAGKPGDPKHPLYESTPYVSVVHLVWKYSPDLIPEDLLQFIEIAGENYGVKARKGRKVEVRFMFSPQP